MTNGTSTCVLQWATHTQVVTSICHEGICKTKLQQRIAVNRGCWPEQLISLALIGFYLSVNWL